MAGPEVRLELVGLRKTFGEAPVLAGVDLAVRAGEFVSLLGPSGCGKTTTLNLVAGFLVPDGGEVRIDGRSVAGMPPHRRGLGMVFQSHALFPHLTVAENVGFGLRMRGTPRTDAVRQVAEALAMVRLTGLGTRYPWQLSGGQQQRVGLARALSVRPRVLLLDEPLSSLDAKLRREMQVELRALQRQIDVTTLYVTHDQEEALTLSDRIVLMHRGRVEQVGTPEEVYTRPASEFVASFIGEASFLDGSVISVAGSEAQVELRGGGVVTVTRRPGGLRRGARLRLAVRPDRVGLARTGGGDGEALAGTLAARAFVGRVQRCVVDLRDGPRIQVEVPVGAEVGVAIGGAVAVRVAPEDWMIFPVGPVVGSNPGREEEA